MENLYRNVECCDTGFIAFEIYLRLENGTDAIL